MYIFATFFIFICYWFRLYFTADPIPAVDLPGHVAAVERLADHWWRGELSFYDPRFFTGWPAFQFYGFGAHLVAALLALPLSLMSDEPARLAVHLLLVFACAALPLSIYYAALPLVRQFVSVEHLRSRGAQTVFTIYICTLSFWFLNHGATEFGFGASAVMQSGLFSQLFGWHLVLLYVGALFRMLDTSGSKIVVALLVAALMLTHGLSAVFALFLGGLFFLCYSGRRHAIFRSHLFGLGLSGFWLIPALAYSGEYTTLSFVPPKGDILQLLFYYPWSQLARGFAASADGAVGLVDLTNILMFALFALLLACTALHRSRLIISYAVCLVIAGVFFNSAFVAETIPLGLHYYRFMPLLVLGILVLLVIVPMASIAAEHVSRRKVLFLGFAPVLCFSTAVLLPAESYLRMRAEVKNDFFAHQQSVLNYLSLQNDVGRVYFEYANDPAKFFFPTPHFVSSSFASEAGAETINGLFIQSSLAYQFPTIAARELGAETYSQQLFISKPKHRDDRLRVEQLRGLGVSHVVVVSEAFLQRLLPFVTREPVMFGPYAVLQIAERKLPMAQPVVKPLLAYLDLRGDLPFKFIEHYFNARIELAGSFELLLLGDNRDVVISPTLTAIIVNGDKAELPQVRKRLALDASVDLIPLAAAAPVPLDHYRIRYGVNRERTIYRDLEHYLDHVLLLPEMLRKFHRAPLEPNANIGFAWRERAQRFDLTGMRPGELVRINYAHFPHWRSEDGIVFRGSQERMFFLPKDKAAVVRYQPWGSGVSWFALVCSLISLLWIVRQRFRAG